MPSRYRVQLRRRAHFRGSRKFLGTSRRSLVLPLPRMSHLFPYQMIAPWDQLSSLAAGKNCFASQAFPKNDESHPQPWVPLDSLAVGLSIESLASLRALTSPEPISIESCRFVFQRSLGLRASTTSLPSSLPDNLHRSFNTMSHLEKGEKGDNGTIGTGPTPLYRSGPVRRPIANPGPLGLFAFASTTLILSLYNVQASGVKTPNVVIGMALFVGGLGQFMAGMWEFACGNVFGATAFSMYGGFWASYATLFIPSSGILAAYTDPNELASALGIYLITWFIVTFLLLIASLRHNVGLIALFFFLMITFILLGAAEFTGSVAVTKAGGAVGVVTALIAYYAGLAQLLVREESWFTLPLGAMPRRLD